MGKLKTQNDIVAKFLQNKQFGETTEELCLPNIDEWFFKLPINARVKSDKLRIPHLAKLATKARRDVAETLASLIEYKPGVVGFRWRLGNDFLELRYVDGFNQKTFDHEGEEEKFVELFTTILKSRANILELEWDFGDDHVKVTYE